MFSLIILQTLILGTFFQILNEWTHFCINSLFVQLTAEISAFAYLQVTEKDSLCSFNISDSAKVY